MRTLDTTDIELLVYFKFALFCVIAAAFVLFILWCQLRKIVYFEIADEKPRKPKPVRSRKTADEEDQGDDNPPPEKPKLRIVR